MSWYLCSKVGTDLLLGIETYYIKHVFVQFVQYSIVVVIEYK